ncbi:hypothetical protein KP509_26G025700 [Ceratopteris richardii]|nr:hypothetical protein KP509_26G025700 [Ceratopteris richardii]
MDDDHVNILVVLNYQIPLITFFLWKKAALRVCADGGANQLYDCIPHFYPHEDPTRIRTKFKPDLIKGDLDSLRPEVKAFYQGLGTCVLDASYDQDTTDLHKCVSHVLNDNVLSDCKPNQMRILVVGALGGRLDHEFGNLNILYSFPNSRIILINDESMVFLLSKEFIHRIHINRVNEGPYCGLIPLGNQAKSTTTTGLRWNLEGQSMEFGGLISVCNQLQSDDVTVMSDTDLIWTVTIDKVKGWLKESIATTEL